MPQFERFADVVHQNTAVLRALLAGGGDAPERVWAAWALALRQGASASPVLNDSAHAEPSAGVRAHFALMLVACGERAAAMTMARCDPSATVRATAFRCLARLATPSDDELNALLNDGLLNDGSPEVHAALLDGLRTDAPAALRAHALHRVEDEDAEVRERAIDFTLRVGDGERGFSDALRARASRETDSALRIRLFDAWIAADGVDSVLRSASSFATSQLLVLLARCENPPSPLRFDDLAPLASRGEPSIDRWLVRCEEMARTELPRLYLLDLVDRHLREARGEWGREATARFEAADYARSKLVPILAHTSREELTRREQRLVDEMAAMMKHEGHTAFGGFNVDVERHVRRPRVLVEGAPGALATLDGEHDDAYDDEGDRPSVFGHGLLAELRRLRSM